MPEYDITTDGKTVWVNGAGGLLGRFGRFGIDIHRLPEEQLEHGECLFCTHTPTTRADWDLFVGKMREHHDVVVHPRHMPDRFRRRGDENIDSLLGRHGKALP